MSSRHQHKFVHDQSRHASLSSYQVLIAAVGITRRQKKTTEDTTTEDTGYMVLPYEHVGLPPTGGEVVSVCTWAHERER